MKILHAFDSIAEGDLVDHSWKDYINSVTISWTIGIISLVWWIAGIVKELA